DVMGREGTGGTSTFTFTVFLSRPSLFPVTVNYTTVNGTALAGTDYQTTAGTLTIPAGAASGSIDVTVIGDAIPEPNGTFSINLSSPVNATIARARGTATILDDDPAPALSIGDLTVREGSGTNTLATFTVFL